MPLLEVSLLQLAACREAAVAEMECVPRVAYSASGGGVCGTLRMTPTSVIEDA